MEVILPSVKPEKAFLNGQDEFGLETCFLSVTFPIEKWAGRTNSEALHWSNLGSRLSS